MIDDPRLISAKRADLTWLSLVHAIYTHGLDSNPRGMKVKEILGVQTRFNMQYPVVDVPARKLGHRFLAAEAWWILTGQNAVLPMAPYSKHIPGFSNDGYVFDGAYGPKVIDQLRYVVDCLHGDRDTRQAVMNIWRENPRPSKDIPCTISAQFLIRNGYLNVVDTMRSSDIWLGWPYDAFNFSMLGALVILLLKKRGVDVELGQLIMNFGSSHLYERNFEQAEAVLNISHVSTLASRFDLGPFPGPLNLINWLERAKDRKLDRFEPLYEVFK